MFKINILGCGSSSGVPVLGCTCKVCLSILTKNKRMRSSILITIDNTNIIIDTGPDFRQQILNSKTHNIGHALYTHTHSDHCLGIDDLRVCTIYQKKPIDIYATKKIIYDFQERFAFLFHAPKHINRPWQKLQSNIIQYNIPFMINDVTIYPFEQQHGTISTTGFILKHNNIKIAYSTDIKLITTKTIEHLKSMYLDLWIVGYIGYHGSIAHASPNQIMEWIKIISPKQTVFTHMGDNVDYYQLSKNLHTGIQAGFDGMQIILR
ncbi:phosphoribosyl 1,2-cyclic phosphate phosphodiesterase [Candidatus Xenohaliotis californiensis]|uniref:Phosphoribosyl 1,2-cyclic phosphate phosphodiesterase n=1 Tax=Candidatus Xenohaliotis californiensis TaxID=84677 RepID=A0ABM9N8P3_9RICK|nr:phosphoribosyl 1,2-cyclic phosphate phosphodiesterase [Candidatus Xenohaliotis californiensis]